MTAAVGVLSPAWVTGNRAVFVEARMPALAVIPIPNNVKWPPARWGFHSFRIRTALLLFPQAPRSLSRSLEGGTGPTQVAHAPSS